MDEFVMVPTPGDSDAILHIRELIWYRIANAMCLRSYLVPQEVSMRKTNELIEEIHRLSAPLVEIERTRTEPMMGLRLSSKLGQIELSKKIAAAKTLIKEESHG